MAAKIKHYRKAVESFSLALVLLRSDQRVNIIKFLLDFNIQTVY